MKSAVWSGHPAGLVSSIAEMEGRKEGRKILFGRKLVITFENFVLKAELIFWLNISEGWGGAL